MSAPAGTGTATRYPSEWEMDAVLADGATVHVRPIRPDDAGALRAFHAGLSPETVYFRYFAPHPRLSEREVERLTHVDYRDRLALVAVHEDALVAVARYDRLPGTPTAEVAFVVADAHQGRGLGTLLLEYLAAAARQHGMTRFQAETLSGNRRMLEVFHAAGFRDVHRLEGDVTHVVMEISPTVAAEAAAEEREWSASVRSVRRLLRPRSVAVVGAGRSGGIGRNVFDNLIEGGFEGPLYPVNRGAETVAGLAAYPSVRAIGEKVDLAVVAVPAAAVLDVVEDCAAAGVEGVVVVTSGFGETGAAGRDLERAVVERAHLGGMRVVGPNCIGIVNTARAVRLNASFLPHAPLPGHVAFASQSGALGIAMLEWSRSVGLGMSSFVSMGNKADVSSNDLLRHWYEDAETDVILLYLESFGNPRMFAKVARRVARRKPIVAVKAGRSAAGGRAAASHTAAMATPDTTVDALFGQAGVIRVDDLAQLFEVGGLLATQPLPAGPRVAVVGNAGGAGIMAADALSAAGLTVPEFGGGLQEAIRRLWPASAGVSNPVDLGAAAGAEAYGAIVEAVLGSGEVDSLIAIHAPVPQTDAAELARAVAAAASDGERPVLATFLGMQDAPRPAADGIVVPTFSFPEPAAQALAAVTAYARWRERPPGSVPRLARVDAAAAQATVHAALEARPEGGWLPPDAVGRLLDAYGIVEAPAQVVTSATGAARAAREVGLPVALKVVADQLAHKTDVGGVVLGLRTAEEVRRAYVAMAGRIGGAMRGAVVQHMVSGGVEVITGVVQDPLFGPLLMFGSGGTAVEVFADRAFRILPVTDADALELIGSIRGARLLAGHRGAPPVDMAALQDLLLRVAQLAEDLPQVAEMDLNPVIASPAGAVVVDAKLRVAPWQERPWLTVRRLRPVGAAGPASV